MTFQAKVYSALVALLLVVLATWGAREHLNKKTIDSLTLSLRTVTTQASTQSLQIQSLQTTVNDQRSTIAKKDELIRLASRTVRKVVVVRAVDGSTRTESDTVVDVKRDSETSESEELVEIHNEVQRRLDVSEQAALTTTAEVERLKTKEKDFELDQVRSAPKLAVLLGYDLADLGDGSAPDYWHRARAGLGWPIGLATLGVDVAPAYALDGQWNRAGPQARLDLLFR